MKRVIERVQRKIRKDQRGITGLETAIVLIAFVVVASVFAFAVITTGLFSSEEAQSSAQAGVTAAKSTMTPKGSMVLEEAQATIVVTLPPMASLEKLTPWRFRIARSLLFPGRHITLDDALDRTRSLYAGLRTLGERPGLTVVEPDSRWYGLDPIHPRRRCLTRVWREALGPWASDTTAPTARPSPRRWVRLRTLTPQRWWLLGREMGRPQPAWVLRDGSSFWLF